MHRPAAKLLAAATLLTLKPELPQAGPATAGPATSDETANHLIQETLGSPPPGPLALTHEGHRYTGYLVDTREAALTLTRAASDGALLGQLDAARAWTRAQGRRFLFATNSGIFEPGFVPSGLSVSGGVEQAPLNLRAGEGNFYLQPGAVFWVDASGRLGVTETHAYAASPPPDVQHATQSGPALLLGGALHPAFNEDSSSTKLRSGVGVISEHQAVFLRSDDEVRFFDFAEVFRDRFGCEDALFLDGTISELLTGDEPAKEQRLPFAGIWIVSDEGARGSED